MTPEEIRAIQYAGQIAGTAIEGLLEILEPSDTSPLRRPICPPGYLP